MSGPRSDLSFTPRHPTSDGLDGRSWRPGCWWHRSSAPAWAAMTRGSPAHHWDFGDMPPIPGLNDDEIGLIIAHVRERQEAHGHEPYPPGSTWVQGPGDDRVRTHGRVVPCTRRPPTALAERKLSCPARSTRRDIRWR